MSRTLLALFALVAVSAAFTLPKHTRKLAPFVPEVFTQEQKNSFLCPMCEGFITEVEAELEKDEPDLENKCNEMCEKFFGPFAMICENLVDQELEQIVAWIKDNESPEQVCKQLHIC